MKLLQLVGLACLIAPLPSFALQMIEPITKESQARSGVKFTLKAVHVRVPDTVVVEIEAPLEGKLKSLSIIQVVLSEKDEFREGEMIDYSMVIDVATTKTKDGKLKASFSMKPALAKKCHILLYTEVDETFAHVFDIRVREYIEEK